MASRDDAENRTDSESCPPELLKEPDREGPDTTQFRGLRQHRPGSLRAAMLVGLLVLAVLYAVYHTRALLLPITFALLFNFLLQPLTRLLHHRWRVPYPVSTALIMLVFVGSLVGIGFALSDPALDWLERAPQSVSKIQQKLSGAGAAGPITEVQDLIERVENLAGLEQSDPETMPVNVRGPGLSSRILSYGQFIASGALVTFILLFFLLASGDTFLRKLVHVLPRMHDKRQAVAIAHQVEHSISTYLVTVTVINLALGLATAGAMWLVGLNNPLLWGALAFVFNYVPYLGPVAVMAILLAVGLVSFDSAARALLAPAAFGALNLMEAYGLTPLMIGQRLSLHPVAVLLSIVFWFFMWGVAGALIAIPLLVAFKILCDHIEPLEPISEFLSGNTRRPQNHYAGEG